MKRWGYTVGSGGTDVFFSVEINAPLGRAPVVNFLSVVVCFRFVRLDGGLASRIHVSQLTVVLEENDFVVNQFLRASCVSQLNELW